jgi:hypothetical protein
MVTRTLANLHGTQRLVACCVTDVCPPPLCSTADLGLASQFNQITQESYRRYPPSTKTLRYLGEDLIHEQSSALAFKIIIINPLPLAME